MRRGWACYVVPLPDLLPSGDSHRSVADRPSLQVPPAGSPRDGQGWRTCCYRRPHVSGSHAASRIEVRPALSRVVARSRNDEGRPDLRWSVDPTARSGKDLVGVDDDLLRSAPDELPLVGARRPRVPPELPLVGRVRDAVDEGPEVAVPWCGGRCGAVVAAADHLPL